MSAQPPVTFGSVNEQNVYQALAQAKLDFEYQYPIDGGRGVRGGQVIDFVIYLPPKPIALYVQGKYWHSGARNVEENLKESRAEKYGLQVMEISEDESKTTKQVSDWLRMHIL